MLHSHHRHRENLQFAFWTNMVLAGIHRPAHSICGWRGADANNSPEASEVNKFELASLCFDIALNQSEKIGGRRSIRKGSVSVIWGRVRMTRTTRRGPNCLSDIIFWLHRNGLGRNCIDERRTVPYAQCCVLCAKWKVCEIYASASGNIPRHLCCTKANNGIP